jgi:phosphoglucomutase
MQTGRTWEEISAQLVAEFSKLSPDRKLIDNAILRLRLWLDDPLYELQKSAIQAHITAGQNALLFDAFYQVIPFGTGGRRGRVGYGPNRINNATVALSVQGHCNSLRQRYASNDTRSVVVAFDTRVFRDLVGAYTFLGPEHPILGLTSRALAYQACEIYAGNGFTAYAPDLKSGTSYLSTPELSFTIRHLGAVGGVNMSASHNHPDDNGFKFYNSQGGQDIPPVDELLASFIDNVHEVSRLPFKEGVEQNLIRILPPDTHAAYIETNLKLRNRHISKSFPVAYTPLSGTGDSTVGDVLRAAGYVVEMYKPQANFDGTFASIPYRLPNPEVPESASPALRDFHDKKYCMLLSTDPDADRIGVYARTKDGDWRHLTGNDIASILTYYLILDKQYGPRKTGLIIKTLVTTRSLESMAKIAGCKIIPGLLVGFKYMAHVLDRLETEGCYDGIEALPRDLIIAAEESHGVLLTPEIRDKDAAGGALLLSELMSQLWNENRTLPEYLDALSIECGNYANATKSIVMRGILGTQSITAMMQSLRSDPVSRFGDFDVLATDDYLSVAKFGRLLSETDRLSRNLVLFKLDGAQVVIRPSGTEPKVKIYADIEGRRLIAGNDRRAAETLAQNLAEVVFDTCTDIIGVRLSPSAKLLPDHVDLSLKKEFDQIFRPALVEGAQDLARQGGEELTEWLRHNLSSYGGGADPLEVTTHAVAHLCQTLRKDTSNPELQRALLRIESRLAAPGGSAA